MSDIVYTEPYITKEDHQDRILDIYVSAESLRVFENPWVECTSPHTPGFGGTRQSGTDTTSVLQLTCIWFILVTLQCTFSVLLGVGCVVLLLQNQGSNQNFLVFNDLQFEALNEVCSLFSVRGQGNLRKEEL